FAPLELSVTGGSLKLNQAPVGQQKLDWSLAEAQLGAGVPFSLAVPSTLSLHVEGNAKIAFAELLKIEGSFALDQFDVLLPATPDAGYAQLGAGATGLALQLQISGGTPDGGVSGSGTLQLLQVTSASGLSWLGVEATELGFELAFAPLELSVTGGSLKLNQAPVGQQKLDWSLAEAQLGA